MIRSAKSSPGILALLYHRVSENTGRNPFNTVVSLKRFTAQIDSLQKLCPVISLSDAAAQLSSGRMRSDVQAVLTFDDGHRDMYEKAFPVLRTRGLPAAIFLATDYVGGKMPFDRMKPPRPSIRREIMRFLKPDLKDGAAIEREDGGCVTWEEAREMMDAGFEIGSHGMSHRSLTGIPVREAAFEIIESKRVIEDRLGRACSHFAFPFGSPLDYNQTLIDRVRDAGYMTCLLNVRGRNSLRKDIFRFRRLIMDDSVNIENIIERGRHG